jgi:pilus assembly protein Flp/PilA
MNDLAMRACLKLRTLVDDSGQDLIEYALVVALIAFAATAGMNTVATGINAGFTTISGKINSHIT